VTRARDGRAARESRGWGDPTNGTHNAGTIHRPLAKGAYPGNTVDMAKPALDVQSLSSDEKLELIDELWRSLEPADFDLTPPQRDELDRRLERLEREGPGGTSWESVRASMTRRDP
jgi:putative addiction module component (TIGR02574 family)